MQQELIIWALGLVLGLPCLILILGELVERLERQQNPLAPVVRQIRNVMLPVLTLLLIMRHILSVEEAESSARLVATLFWMVVVYAVFNLVRALIQLGAEKPTAWHANVPPLFFALCRGAILFWAITHILSNILGGRTRQTHHGDWRGFYGHCLGPPRYAEQPGIGLFVNR